MLFSLSSIDAVDSRQGRPVRCRIRARVYLADLVGCSRCPSPMRAAPSHTAASQFP